MFVQGPNAAAVALQQDAAFLSQVTLLHYVVYFSGLSIL